MSSAVAVTNQPPSYSAVQPPPFLDSENVLDDLVATAPVPDLPAYTPGQRVTTPPTSRAVTSQNPKEFYYELKKRGKTFAILTIIAEGTYSKHMPTFVEGSPVKGRVRLILDKPDPIQSVVVTILGQFITGANQGEQLTFIDISHTLWSQADGEPRNVSSNDARDSSSAPPGGAASPPTKFSGKLQGDYTWSFSIDLPKQVVVAFGSRDEPQVFTPPQTFNERHTRASISYEVSLRLMRNKLRTDHRIPAQFGYVPLTRPPPFPPLRRLAYQEGSPLLGPTVDLDGWYSPEPVRIKGKIFNTRALHVGCQLFLAKPLSYTRGTVIPLCLRLEGDDQQGLDLLSSPKAIVLRLRRRIKYHYNAEKKLESFAWKDAIDHSQLAVWWPSAEGSEDRFGRVRYVNGELHLRSDIKPTSAVASFRIEYSVVLFPFDAAGIELLDSDPLLEQPVDIVTAYAPGPRSRMFAPPGYESDIPVQQSNILSTLTNSGFL
ncbi:hypothetical protein BDZ97DRAFT_1916318 [Flammula alnicola]|nr:hypothetical protein BDZ97DRAFT_1916318 [Flammula alnicola]